MLGLARTTRLVTLGIGLAAVGSIGCQSLPWLLKIPAYDSGGWNAFTRERSGFWTFYYTDGGKRLGKRAEGRYREDQQDGEWSYYHENGERRWTGNFSSEKGIHGTNRFWYPNGNLQAEGRFARGVEDGAWRFFHEDGSPLCEGQYDRGKLSGTWTYYYEGGAQAATGTWDQGQRVGTWTYRDAAGNPMTEPSPDTARVLASRPVIPVVGQPDLTNKEVENFLMIKEHYLNAAAGDSIAKTAKKTGNSDYGGDFDLAPVQRDEDGSEACVGKSIGPIRVLRGDRTETTLGELIRQAGRENTIVVVLRGMQNEVCAYCLAQTKSLVDAKPRFDRIDAEVIVVYPGDPQRRREFERLYRQVLAEFQEAGSEDIPYELVSDPELALPKELGIVADLAQPTSLITDREGQVLWAYVGNDESDRPSANVLRDELEQLRAGE